MSSCPRAFAGTEPKCLPAEQTLRLPAPPPPPPQPSARGWCSWWGDSPAPLLWGVTEAPAGVAPRLPTLVTSLMVYSLLAASLPDSVSPQPSQRWCLWGSEALLALENPLAPPTLPLCTPGKPPGPMQGAGGCTRGRARVAVMFSQGFQGLCSSSGPTGHQGELGLNILSTCWVAALSHHCLYFMDENTHRGYVPCHGPTGSLALEQGFLTAALLAPWVGSFFGLSSALWGL